MPRGEKTKFQDNSEKNSSNLEFLIKITAWKNSEKVDIFDPEQCNNRVAGYFELCMKYDHNPTLTELASVLCINRQRIYEIYTGNHYPGSMYAKLPAECQQIIRDGYNIILGNVESKLVDGDANISHIFIAKNMGIKDTNDMFDNSTTRETPDVERLKTQYLNQLPDKGESD